MVTAATRTRDLLWSDIEGVYAAVREHPFLAGLADGSLPRETFRRFVVQDAHYLRGYARALALRAARAPDDQHGDVHQGAARAIAAEQGMHAGLAEGLGTTAEAAAEPLAPTTPAYLSYLLATAYGGSFPEGLGAVLPCYWIYAAVGEELVAGARPTRSTPAGSHVRRGGVPGGRRRRAGGDRPRRGRLCPAELRRCAGTPPRPSRYEWMFWDAG